MNAPTPEKLHIAAFGGQFLDLNFYPSVFLLSTEKAPPKKLAQELDSSSKDTGSSHDQDDVEMEDEDSPVPGLRISSIVTMSRK